MMRRGLGILGMALAALGPAWASISGMKMSIRDYAKNFSNPGEQQLVAAVAAGDLAAMKRLAAEGVPLNPVGKYKSTPLRVALLTGQHAALQFLLRNGVNPNYVSPRGSVPAFTATRLLDSALLTLLLDHGLSPNTKEEGEPLLIAAIREARWDNVRLLVKRGADINARTANQSSAMLELVGMSEYDLAREFILGGADVTTANGTGLTPVDVLVNDQKNLGGNPNAPRYRQRAELLQLLRQRGVPVPPGY